MVEAATLDISGKFHQECSRERERERAAEQNRLGIHKALHIYWRRELAGHQKGKKKELFGALMQTNWTLNI